jgi:phosphoribosylformylglycinamidine synthase
MLWRVEISTRSEISSALAGGIEKDIEDLGIKGVKELRLTEVYFIEGSLSEPQIVRICEKLLCDSITQEYAYRRETREERGKSRVESRESDWGADLHTIEVAYNPGVMDPVEESTKKGMRDMGIEGTESVKTARKYLIRGKLSPQQIDTICEKLLLNKLIQHVVKEEEKISLPSAAYDFKLLHVDLLSADQPGLERISRQGQLFLNLTEMLAIKDDFARLGRNPTDVELETLAQTWSEHCVHKTFRGLIEFQGEVIDNLMKSTIFRATEELNKPWCISVFKDNAGIISFDQDYSICFKVETHNHPSALEPYGGAGTGIGGVIRDPLGTGLGAKPILNTDIFCFGPPDYPHEKLPKGVLHPKRIMKGVVGGVRDYGNRMGIPTANGSIFFDEGYLANPLVYCGNVGLIPNWACQKRVNPGDFIVVVGGRTGRDGIHGATFSSGELTEESEKISGGAVQIGNPIMEKKMADTLLQARDAKLYSAITDCGAGGLSSAVGEMGVETGATVDLEKVPLKYNGLGYTEIWISEAQERMVLSVPQKNLSQLLEVFAREDVEATVIGQFTSDKHLRLKYQGHTVADLDMEFLHHGLPRTKKKATWEKPRFPEPSFPDPENLTPYLEKILSSWNVCSKEWVIRQYDHEVQGGSVLKPLVGVSADGPGDACIVRPRLSSYRGIIVSNGINPRYGLIDPYWMAASAIDEALRQIIAVGGNLNQVGLLDNFCWGSPEKPENLGALVKAAQACYQMATAYETPFISGKDSLNNEYSTGGRTISIPPTLLISAVAVIEDVRKAISMDVKEPGDLLYVVGTTRDEMGGGHYYLVRGWIGNQVPTVDPSQGKQLMESLSQATEFGLVRACHDCSEGGIGVACAEMAFAGDLGMEIELKSVPTDGPIERNDALLFSESNSRFIVEVPLEYQDKFEQIMSGCPIGQIGKITNIKEFKVYGLEGNVVLSADIKELKQAWQSPLRW